jgi:hypothetical protein
VRARHPQLHRDGSAADVNLDIKLMVGSRYSELYTHQAVEVVVLAAHRLLSAASTLSETAVRKDRSAAAAG